MFNYWRRVIVRAWNDTTSSLGHTFKRLIIGMLATVISFGILGYFISFGSASDKLSSWIVGLAVAACVFMLVLAKNLLFAPKRLEDEMAETHKKTIQEKDVRIASYIILPYYITCGSSEDDNP